MKPKTLHRLLWRLSAGRPVVVDAPEHVTELRRLAEVPVTVELFTDRRDHRAKYRMVRG